MSALSDLSTAALSAPGGPYTVQIGQGAANSAATGYHLIPTNTAGPTVDGIGGGYSVAQLAASITAGTPIVTRPSAQQTSRTTDSVWG
jgi:hypothetical protein